MMSGFIVEGVAGAGKTTLLSAVQRRLAEEFPSCTKFFVSEHYTDRVFEDERYLGPIDLRTVLSHTAEIVDIVARFGEVKRASKFRDAQANAATPVFLERWIGSHVAHVRTQVSLNWPTAPLPEPDQSTNQSDGLWREIQRQYKALLDLGLGVIVLRVDAAEIRTRLASTLVQRNTGWATYVGNLGGLDAATQFFCEWQDHLLRFYEELGLDPVVIPGVRPHDVNPIAQYIVSQVTGLRLAG